MAYSTVLLDMDGVVRHFDPAYRPAVEERHGLEPGTLEATAFASPLLDRLVTGAMSRAAWVAHVGEATGSPAAANEWLCYRGRVDPEMLAIAGELRHQGTRVAVLTNGTDETADEVVELGIADHVDAVFCSADIGYAKPDRRAFECVCDRLGVEPAEVFFTDDTASKLGGAIEIGMTARVFEGIARFRIHLAELAITVD